MARIPMAKTSGKIITANRTTKEIIIIIIIIKR